MHQIEFALRLIAFSEVSLVALVLFLQRVNNYTYRFAGLLLVGIGCYLLAPLVLHQWQWGMLAYPVFLLAVLIPTFFWFFTHSVFSDNHRIPIYLIPLAIITALLGTLLFFTGTELPTQSTFEVNPILSSVTHLVKLLWLVLSVVIICKEWKADLVESRRQLRRWLVIGCSGYIALIIVVELLFPEGVVFQLDLLNVISILVLVTAASIHLLSINNQNLFAKIVTVVPQGKNSISNLGRKILAAMEQDRMYTEEGLTINVLAATLKEQEYRVRKSINGELGFRNFNDFVNQYRVEEVARRLEQEENQQTPLLTLALDAGFRSLAPFNKSFKQRFGATPSEYRHRLTKEMPSDTKANQAISSDHHHISESNSIFQNQ